MVLFRVPTTTHFNKLYCCMVLWVLLTHNTIQQHILLNVLLWVLETTPTTPYNNTFCENVLLWVLETTPTTPYNNTFC